MNTDEMNEMFEVAGRYLAAATKEAIGSAPAEEVANLEVSLEVLTRAVFFQALITAKLIKEIRRRPYEKGGSGEY